MSRTSQAALRLMVPWLFTSLIAADASTPHLIQAIPAYTSLAPCAESQVRAIVSSMASGCWDDRHMTSHSCFCASSSSHFGSVISTAIVSACTASATEQASSAVDPFHSYCQLGTVPTAMISMSLPSPCRCREQATFRVEDFRPYRDYTRNASDGSQSLMDMLLATTRTSTITPASNKAIAASSTSLETAAAAYEEKGASQNSAFIAPLAAVIAILAAAVLGFVISLIWKRLRKARHVSQDAESESNADLITNN